MSTRMLAIKANSNIDTGKAERRQFQRVTVDLHARYMLPDHSEHAGTVIDMSPGSLRLKAPQSATAGSKVILYIDHIGRVEGEVEACERDGMALLLNVSPRKREKIAAQLTWIANKHELAMPEDRRHERLAPRHPMSVMTLNDGRQYRCRLIDLSLSGAAVEASVRPAMGTQVTLGNMRGQVVRHFEEGIAIEFAFVQQREQLSEFLG